MTDRFRNIAMIWNWLPAFRAVADTEHLPTAGKMMAISGPALSRTIKNLEASLETELFLRSGRSLKLNSDGQKLVVAIRIAMRTINNAIDEIKNESLSGPFRWTSTWSASLFAISAIEDLVKIYPEIEPQMQSFVPALIIASLQRGELDLGLMHEPVNIEGLTCTLVHEQKYSVFCSPDHELAQKENLKLSDLCESNFVVPIRNNLGFYSDGWPQYLPRKVTMQFTQMESGYQACLAGHALAVLPNTAAKGLVALVPIDTKRNIYAIHRKTLTQRAPEHIVQFLKSNF